jgi:uncharacterized membrane protein YcaP (DUF421 family)
METVYRVLVAYVVVMVGLRIIGKRTLGELSPPDLVVLMLIPEFSMTNAFVAVSSLLLFAMVTELLSYRYPAFGRIVSGKPVTMVSHGHLRADRMDLERVSSGEILEAMHKAGLERIEQVKWGVLYPDGTIAVVPWEQPRPGSDRTDDRPI